MRCDRDGVVNGSCTFGVQICVGVADPALPCLFDSNNPHLHLTVQKPSAIDAARSPAAAAVRTQLETFAPLLTGAGHTCTDRLDMVVPMKVAPTGFHKGKMALKTLVWEWVPTRKYDGDSLRLFCTP